MTKNLVLRVEAGARVRVIELLRNQTGGEGGRWGRASSLSGLWGRSLKWLYVCRALKTGNDSTKE